jgi:alanyl-tRNA synthetase
MPYPDAIAAGAIAIFEEKYGDQVRVIAFGDFSTELCGGTHARATGEIGLLKVLSESGIAAGVRRIEAQTGLGALEWVRAREALLERAAGLLRVPAAEVPERIERLLDERRALERELEGLRAAARGAASQDLTKSAREVAGVRVLSARVDGTDAKSLRGMVDDLRSRLGSAIVLLAAEEGGRVSLAIGVTPDLVARFRAGDLVREVSQVLGGKGGGRPDFAQGGGSDPARLDDAFRRLDELVGGA